MADLRTHFNLFTYGTLRRGGKNEQLLAECEVIARGEVGGVLYEIEREYPALVLYGSTPVSGDVWRCPNEMLAALDEFEAVDKGLFRRVGVNVRSSETGEELACWTYVAGPALSQKLVPSRRITKWTS